ncbi:MAG TPA: hypothetical protein VEG63_13975 [Candidatus Acidoferrales bacterium]|nr:hypothetical protein [Candidatus Acidoferrales bacterium]
MKPNRRTTQAGLWLRAIALAALVCGWLPGARAQQDPSQDPQQDNGQEYEGINGTKYNIKQSIEIGGRIDSISGDGDDYKTFVNLQQGMRLLSFTTEMRALDNKGDLFDRLYLNSFGYGGDPNDVTRLRVTKYKWYDFDVQLRRDEYFWDYSLLANPLNPTTGFANGPAGFGPLATSICTGCVLGDSPHLFDTRRYLSDYNLVFLPQSRVRFRFGYSRNIDEGPSFTTLHQGTEQVLFQDVKTTVNTYRMGVDYRVLPRTNISYDEIWYDYKGDTGATDQLQQPNFRPNYGLPLDLFQLSNGEPVDLGASFNSTASQPCGGTFLATGAVNPTCSAFLSYLRHGRVRTKTPTEQVSLQSSYWKNVEVSARFGYTAGSADEFGYVEDLLGRESRSNLFNSQTQGTVNGERVASSADFGLTWHITNALSFLDSYRFSTFHNPMQFSFNDCSFFSTNLLTAPNVFTPTSPLPVLCTPQSTSAAGTPVHTTSAEPDLAIDVDGGFLKQAENTNLAELDYQVSSKFGARAGFRYRHREIDDKSFADNMEFYFPSNANRGDCALVMGMLPAGCTPIGGGAFEFVTPVINFNPGQVLINEYSGLFGVWARPVQNWRISFDTELMSADNVFTRISPRQWQEYRVRSVYKPVNWVNISGTVRIWEGRDNVTQIDNLQHDRSYGISVMLQPNDKWALDFTYDYNDVFSQILVCYPGTPSGPGINKCVNVAGLVEQLSVYKNDSNYGGFDLMWKPLRPLTTHLGGNFTGNSGSALFLNPNQEPGPLNSKWLCPTGGLDYAFTKRWTGRAFWNYYGYHEDFTAVPQDIYAPRNFRGNTVTLSARYAF